MSNIETDKAVEAPRSRRIGAFRGRLPAFDVAPATITWIGLALATAGFALIVYSWGKVAALLDVSLQMPYVVSGGLIGLALVIVGMMTVNVAARRHDTAERASEVQALQSVLRDLKDTLERSP